MTNSDIAKNILIGKTCDLCYYNRQIFLAGDNLSQSRTVKGCALNKNRKQNTCMKWKKAIAESVHYGTFMPSYSTEKTELAFLDKVRELWKRGTQLNIF